MQTKIMVTVDHDKPLPDLVDLVAGRAWTIDGVRCAEAKQVAPLHVVQPLIAKLNGSSAADLNLYHPLLAAR